MHFDVFSMISKKSGIVVQKTIKYTADLPFCHVLCGVTDSVRNYLRRRSDTEYAKVTVIIDECDEVLENEENVHKIRYILSRIINPQILLYSATLSQKTRNFAKEFMNEYEELIISKPETINPKIKIFNISLAGYLSKENLVFELLKSVPFKLCFVYFNKKQKILKLQNFLAKNGYKVELLCADLNFQQRENIINLVQIGHIKVLLCSDVLSRGFDCKNLDLVINYNCPKTAQKLVPNFESFYHRSGRTGRNNRTGTVVNILNKNSQPLYIKIFNRFCIENKLSQISDLIRSVEENSADYQVI